MHPSVTSSPYGDKRFGRYKPLAILGRGGMANVYLAVSSGPGNFNKLAVIKELKPELTDDPEFVAMFVDEARLAARLQHPNVVHTYEVIEGAGEHAFVMEYLDGQPMNRVRMRLSDTHPERAMGAQLRIVAEALAGLHYAHELSDYDGSPLRIVHRDLSPHNIFVSYAGQVKVVDFGIAKTSDSSAQTQVGVVKGKLTYMAPEQALGEAIDRRADLFAVGLVLWEAVTGERIWKGMQDAAILNLLSTGNLPKVQVIAPTAPHELVRICARALANKPADRYTTAAEFLEDLEAVMRTLPNCPAGRELGELISEAFEAERKDIRALIDDQMRALKPGSGAGFGTGEMSEFPRRESSLRPEALARTHDSATITSISQVSSVLTRPPVSQTSLSSEGRLGAPTATASSSSVGQVSSVSALTAQAPLRAAALGVFATVVVGGLLLALFMAFGRHPRAAVDPPPPATPAEAAQASIAPAPATLRLRVNVTPRNARTTLDGAALLTPGPTLLAVDAKPHTLSVAAAGYVSRSIEVILDGDKEIDVALDKLPASAPVTATSRPAVRPPGVSTTPPKPETDLGY